MDDSFYFQILVRPQDLSMDRIPLKKRWGEHILAASQILAFFCILYKATAINVFEWDISNEMYAHTNGFDGPVVVSLFLLEAFDGVW